MVRDVARVVGVIASMVVVETDANEEVINAYQIYASSMVVVDRCRLDLCLLHGLGGVAVQAGGLDDLVDGECESICHGYEVRDDDHLVHIRSYTNTPYMACHYR